MKIFITERFAILALLSILSLFVVFHLLVITGVIPSAVVWGGNLQDRGRVITFEIIAIVLNFLMLLLVAVRGGLLGSKRFGVGQNVLMWLMTAFFFLNTVGNIFSNDRVEKIIFAPITLLLFLFCLRLAVSPRLPQDR